MQKSPTQIGALLQKRPIKNDIIIYILININMDTLNFDNILETKNTELMEIYENKMSKI